MTDNAVSAESLGAATASSGAPDVIYLPDDRQRVKKVTSGSENRRRHNVERFRTDDAEHDALHQTLRACGVSLGEYVMGLSQIGSGKFSRPRRRGNAAVNTVALTQAVVAFNRVGSNQNQIARALNELALVAREQGALRLESQIMQLTEAIRALPDLFAEPMAAIMAALNDGDDDE